MKTKKIIALSLALCLSCSLLAGCGGDKNDEKDAGGKEFGNTEIVDAIDKDIEATPDVYNKEEGFESLLEEVEKNGVYGTEDGMEVIIFDGRVIDVATGEDIVLDDDTKLIYCSTESGTFELPNGTIITMASGEVTSVVENNSDEIANESSQVNKKIATFINKLYKDLSDGIEMENVSEYYHMPADAFMTSSDLEWINSRIGLDVILEYKANELEIVSLINETDGILVVGLDSSDGYDYNIPLVLDDDGNYKVDVMEHFASNVSIQVGTVGEIVFDGVQIAAVEDNNLDNGSSIFKFGGLTLREHTITHANDIYESVNVALEITEDMTDEVVSGAMVLDTNQGSVYLPIIKELWTNIVKNAIENKTTEAIAPYFVDGFDAEKLENWGTNMQENLDIAGVPEMTNIAFITDYNSVVPAENKVKIYFKYVITYENKTLGTRETSDAAYMILELQEDGSYKVAGLYEDLFNKEYNMFTDNWNKYN